MDLVFVPQFLVKVPHVQIEIHFPIKPQNLLGGFHWDPVRASLASSLIEQPAVAEFLISLSHPPHCSVGYPRDLGCLHPADLLGHRLQYHVLQFHHPLHGCGAYRSRNCQTPASPPLV